MPSFQFNKIVKEDKYERISMRIARDSIMSSCTIGSSKSIVAVPTIFIEGQYRFAFVSFDLGEPLHVHVKIENRSAKFWVKDDKYGKKDIPEEEWKHLCKLERNYGMKPHELNDVALIIEERRDEIVQKWESELNKDNNR